MVRYESQCVDCDSSAYPCNRDICPMMNVPHFYCDECGYDSDKIYKFDRQELCIDCIEKRLEVVKGEWNG